MMAAEKPTLKSIKSSPKLAEQHFRPSDFLTKQQQDELREANARGRTIMRPYDEVDAFAAEILARFGWQAYKAWQMGEFSQEKALRFIAAERARDAMRLHSAQTTPQRAENCQKAQKRRRKSSTNT